MVDLDDPLFFIDRVEDAVPPGPQAPQIRRPVRERLRRPRLIGELANSVPERSDTDGTVAEEARRLVPAHALAATMARATALTDSLHWNYPTRRSTNRSTRTARQRSMAVSDRSARTDLLHGG